MQVSNKSKYRVIVEEIKKQISVGSLPVGHLLPSQNELMAQYGVALSTVRQALNTLQSEGWVDSQKGRGTFVRTESVSQPERWDPKNFIGLALLDVEEGKEPIPHHLFMKLHMQVQNAGKELLLRWFQSNQLDQMLQWAKGVEVVLLYNGVTETVVRQLLEHDKKVVIVGNMKEGNCPPGASYLWTDEYGIIESGLDFLISTGHRRITMVIKTGHNIYDDAVRAFNELIKKKDLDRQGCRVYQLDGKTPLVTNTERERVVSDLIADKPDAIFWSGTYGAEICIAQLMRMGIRVPEDISIMAESCSPPNDLSLASLTVVCSELGELFQTAVDLAINGNVENHVYRQRFGCRLFIGDTVAIKRS